MRHEWLEEVIRDGYKNTIDLKELTSDIYLGIFNRIPTTIEEITPYQFDVMHGEIVNELGEELQELYQDEVFDAVQTIVHSKGEEWAWQEAFRFLNNKPYYGKDVKFDIDTIIDDFLTIVYDVVEDFLLDEIRHLIRHQFAFITSELKIAS